MDTGVVSERRKNVRKKNCQLRYLREPRSGFLNCDCRTLFFFRLGLLNTNVPLPRYSAL